MNEQEDQETVPFKEQEQSPSPINITPAPGTNSSIVVLPPSSSSNSTALVKDPNSNSFIFSFTPAKTFAELPSEDKLEEMAEDFIEETRGKLSQFFEMDLNTRNICCHCVLPGLLVATWSVLILYSQFMWEKSLVTCNYDIIVCIKWLKKKFFVVVYYILIYATIHFFIFVNAMFLKTPYVRWTGYAMSGGSFLYRYVSSSGFSTVDHSKANVQICTIIFIIFGLIFGYLYITAQMFKKRALFGFSWTFGSYAFLGLIYYLRLYRSCDHLQDSLVDSIKYSDAGKECKWSRGDICWHYAIDGIFQPLYIGRSRCETMHTELFSHKVK